MINRIQFNVEQSLDYTELAKDDVKKAVEYKNKARHVRKPPDCNQKFKNIVF